MGIIKEPEGVIFLVENKPFNQSDRKLISDFIKIDKQKNKSHNRAHKSVSISKIGIAAPQKDR